MSDNNQEDLNPIDLPLTTKTFQAGGHTYHVDWNGRLSVNRDRWLEKFSLFALLGRQSSVLLVEATKAYNAINESRPADCAIILNNIIKGAADFGKKDSPLYYICSLFINREGENTKTYSLELGEQKIRDWDELPTFFFKMSALNFIQTTEKGWSETIQNISPLNLPNVSPLSQELND